MWYVYDLTLCPIGPLMVGILLEWGGEVEGGGGNDGGGGRSMLGDGRGGEGILSGTVVVSIAVGNLGGGIPTITPPSPPRPGPPIGGSPPGALPPTTLLLLIDVITLDKPPTPGNSDDDSLLIKPAKTQQIIHHKSLDLKIIYLNKFKPFQKI